MHTHSFFKNQANIVLCFCAIIQMHDERKNGWKAITISKPAFKIFDAFGATRKLFAFFRGNGLQLLLFDDAFGVVVGRVAHVCLGANQENRCVWTMMTNLRNPLIKKNFKHVSKSTKKANVSLPFPVCCQTNSGSLLKNTLQTRLHRDNSLVVIVHTTLGLRDAHGQCANVCAKSLRWRRNQERRTGSVP